MGSFVTANLALPPTNTFPDELLVNSNLASLVMFSDSSRLHEILSSTVTELSKNRRNAGNALPEYSVQHNVNSGRAAVQVFSAL